VICGCGVLNDLCGLFGTLWLWAVMYVKVTLL